MKRSSLLAPQTIILLAGTMISLAAIFWVGPNKVAFPDAPDYIAAANSLLENLSYPLEGALPFFRSPLYPFFIALIWLVFPASIFAIKVAQAIIFGLICRYIYRITYTVTNSVSSSVLASLVCLLNPFLIILTTDIQTEILHILLLVSSLSILTGMLVKKEWVSFRAAMWKIFIVGIIFGLAALCRTTALPIGVALGAYTAFLGIRKFKFTKNILIFASMLFGMFLVILPWTAANWYRTNNVILINDAFGYGMWAGNNPKALPLYEGKFSSQAEFDQYAMYVGEVLAKEKMAEWEKTTGYSSLSLKEREDLWRGEALKNMKENPGLTVRLMMHKAWAFWKPYLNPSAYSTKLVLISGLFFVTLYLLSLHGAKLGWKDKMARPVVILFGILFLFATAIHAISIGMIRYRIPYVDPYLSVFVGISLNSLWNRARGLLGR